MYYASFLHSVGRPEEALAQLAVAREIDPLTPTGVLSGRIYVDTHRPDAAIRVLQEAIELDPRHDLAHQLLAHAYLQKGRPDEAIAWMRRAATLSGARDLAQLAYVYARTGDTAEARRVLAGLLEGGEPLDLLGFHLAMAYAALGDSDRAFRWLEAAYAQHASFMNLLAVSTGFESLHSDPRFDHMLRRMGLRSGGRGTA
jgi:tetratricopeptide (TPR) repeat protein